MRELINREPERQGVLGTEMLRKEFLVLVKFLSSYLFLNILPGLEIPYTSGII